MKLATKVQEWLTQNEWSDKIAFDEENQTSSVSFIYIINEQPFKVWVETDENKDMVSVYIYAPFNALPNKLNDCSILFNHINNNTVWGGIFKTWYDEITSVALTKVTAQELINHRNAAPEPEGVVAFDEYVAKQGYPIPLKSVH